MLGGVVSLAGAGVNGVGGTVGRVPSGLEPEPEFEPDPGLEATEATPELDPRSAKSQKGFFFLSEQLFENSTKRRNKGNNSFRFILLVKRHFPKKINDFLELKDFLF